ncbi:17448_t:CDS:2 [Funneliformis geosporum]|nr:17448_t:CDS:2 [Funneliformis geosporum]
MCVYKLSRRTSPLFKASTAIPKRLYEIIKGVSLKNKATVSFVPREFFYSYIFNGTEPLVIVVALKDLYWVLEISQDNLASQGDIEEYPQDSFHESVQDRQRREENEDENGDDVATLNDEFFYKSYEASIVYEKEGSTLNVELFDDTNSNFIKIVPLLQNPIGDIPEPSNRVMFFEMLCYELKMILKDCIKTGSKFQLNGYKYDVVALKFSSRDEFRFVEHNIRAEAFFQCKIDEDFQFTYSKNCIQPLLSLSIDKKSNIEVMVYRNGLMNLKFRPGDVQDSYVNYMVMTMIDEDE